MRGLEGCGACWGAGPAGVQGLEGRQVAADLLLSTDDALQFASVVDSSSSYQMVMDEVRLDSMMAV